jgi:putative ABC transport system permease protein
VLLGFAVTAATRTAGLADAVPLWATAGGVGATLVIGALAGLYPAVRAARLSPTLALGG